MFLCTATLWSSYCNVFVFENKLEYVLYHSHYVGRSICSRTAMPRLGDNVLGWNVELLKTSFKLYQNFYSYLKTCDWTVTYLSFYVPNSNLHLAIVSSSFIFHHEQFKLQKMTALEFTQTISMWCMRIKSWNSTGI